MRVPRGRSLVLAALACSVLAGCDAGRETTCRAADERFPRHPVDIGHALRRDGQLVLVRGALLARRGRPRRLCSSAEATHAPACRGPSVRLEGLRDLAAFESVTTIGADQVVESAVIGGRIDGHTLRLTMSCRTLRVQDGFANATGIELSLDTFDSNDDAEVLDVATVPELMPRRIRERYGVFGITVRTPWARGPNELLDLPAGSFRWIREGHVWIAVKRYGDHVALTWLSDSRRLDERWRRLDRIVNRSS